MTSTVVAAIVIMAIWAIWIVALSRWKYWLSFLASVGCYIGAIVMMRAIGFAPVALAWATMSASSAIIDVAFDRKPKTDETVSPIARTIAAFIVGIVAWPLVFPGTRYPPKSETANASVPTVGVPIASSRANPVVEPVVEPPSHVALIEISIEGNRDEAYERAAALSQSNPGGVIVLDSLAGLKA